MGHSSIRPFTCKERLMHCFTTQKPPFLHAAAVLCYVLGFGSGLNADDPAWKKHTIFEGETCFTAVAADFNKDDRMDVIADVGGKNGKTILFVAPDWRQIILDDNHGSRYIHSETWDIDGDGRSDYVAAAYNPGNIVWYRQPRDANQTWQRRLIDNQIHGIHGVIRGDVNQDGRVDLLATSAQPTGDFPNSLAWYSAPPNPLEATQWKRNIFAVNDAPGLTHYLGFGDIDGDGRPDAATGAKGGPTDTTGQGEWFAWWQAPANPTDPWVKNLLPGDHPGATNIHPVDVNSDGRMDLIASRGHGVGIICFVAPEWQIEVIDPDIKEAHCLQAVDVDQDGDIDAVTCAFGSKECAWYENNGFGKFTKRIVGRDQEAYDIRVVDIDSDGDNDFLIAGRQSKNVVWYENPFQ